MNVAGTPVFFDNLTCALVEHNGMGMTLCPAPVYQHIAMNIRPSQVQHVNEFHAAAIKAEHEHVAHGFRLRTIRKADFRDTPEGFSVKSSTVSMTAVECRVDVKPHKQVSAAGA